MIQTIFRKELLDMLSSWRFVAFTAMLVLLGLIVAVTRSIDHGQALKDYADAESLYSAVLDGGLSPNQMGGLISSPPRRPARMSLIAQGTQESLFERLFVSVYEDPISVLYSSADLLIIMGIVISLGALLLASDLICGERETGAIRLIAANAVRRSSILIGKWMACLVTLGTSILFLFIVVALIVTLMRPDSWTQTDWAGFGALFVFSLVYASSFLMIGMFLSATTRHSGTAAILALMVWTVAVFVMPSLPVYVAREVLRVPSPTYTAISGLRAEEEREKALNALRAPLYARGLSDTQVEEQMDKKAAEKIWAEFWEKRRAENAAFERSILQGLITAVVAHTSPFAAYVIGGTEMAGTGVASMASYLGFTKEQEAALSAHLEKKWQEAVKKNPNAKKSDILDMSDRPRGIYKGDSFVVRMAGALLPLLSLLVFNVLFFVLAWKAFVRYDVR